MSYDAESTRAVFWSGFVLGLLLGVSLAAIYLVIYTLL